MKRSLLVLALLLAAALPASAITQIQGGTDLWITPANGSTYSDFAGQPIPSGFFCNRSAAFTGRIAFKGAPLATDDREVLGETDTIVHRLDDARFDRAGVATTRLQVRALNLVSIQPVRTACGDYSVRATLKGDQPVTRMRIYRENDEGGRFLAPLVLNVKLTFTPVSGRGRSLELTQQIRFPADPRAPWVAVADKGSSRFVRVDTDGDGRPDTVLPGPSNFRAVGLPSDNKITAYQCLRQPYIERSLASPGEKLATTCQQVHTTPGHVHTITPTTTLEPVATNPEV